MARVRQTKLQNSGKQNNVATGQRGKRMDKMPMRTANWPGVPGKKQPRDRSGGVSKCECYPKSEGI